MNTKYSDYMGNGINSDHFPDALIHSKLLVFAIFLSDSGLLKVLYPNIELKFTLRPHIP